MAIRKISDFYVKATKRFSVRIKFDGIYQDISGDVVRFVLKSSKKDPDSEILIDVDADVATNGANGYADFTLTDTHTDQTPDKYYYEVIWTLATNEVYVVLQGSIKLLERVLD